MKDSRLLWFAVGAGAVYLLVRGSGGAGFGVNANVGGVSVGFQASASVPPDQRWQAPSDRDRIGVWDPMGTAARYKDVPDGSTGNGVNTGGGYY